MIECKIVKQYYSGSGGSLGYSAPIFTGSIFECLRQNGRDGQRIVTGSKNYKLYTWFDLMDYWESETRALDVLVALAENQQATIAELVRYTGISERTLRRILHGKHVGARTTQRLEDALKEDGEEWRFIFAETVIGSKCA